MSEVLSLAQYRHRGRPWPPRTSAKDHNVFFNREELGQILSLYSRRIIAGDWRDYAIEWGKEGAAFAVFGRSVGKPLYRIVKRRVGKGAFDYLVSERGRVLGYDRSLKTVLRVLERRALRLVEGG